MIEINKFIEAQILLQALNHHQSVVEQNTGTITNIKIANTQNKKKRLNTIYWLSVVLLYLIGVAYIYFFCQNFIQNMIGADESVLSQLAFIGFFLGLAMTITSLLIYALIVEKTFDHREQKRALTPEEQELYAKCHAEIAASRSAIENINVQLELCSIPPKYLNVYVLGWMIEAIENQRADTPKELYNLYEQYISEERRHQEQMNAIGNISVHNEYNYWG